MDPERVTLADFTIELCDRCLAYVESSVESSKDSWIKIKTFCPWSAEVTDVRDQR